MAQPTQSPIPSPHDLEAFTVQVLRYLDGACSTEDIRQLRDGLAGSAPCREQFVQVCRMKGNLLEVYASKRAELQHKTEPAAATLSAGRVGGSLERGIPIGSERQKPSGDFSGQEAPAAPGPGDPGAETIVGELTGEDTIHPAPKATDQ